MRQGGAPLPCHTVPHTTRCTHASLPCDTQHSAPNTITLGTANHLPPATRRPTLGTRRPAHGTVALDTANRPVPLAGKPPTPAAGRDVRGSDVGAQARRVHTGTGPHRQGSAGRRRRLLRKQGFLRPGQAAAHQFWVGADLVRNKHYCCCCSGRRQPSNSNPTGSLHDFRGFGRTTSTHSQLTGVAVGRECGEVSAAK